MISCPPGHFKMTLTIAPGGPDAQPQVVQQLGLDLSVDGTELLNQAIAPMVTTTASCGGSCASASATLLISGSVPDASDSGSDAGAE
jgi:hypothetical protein